MDALCTRASDRGPHPDASAEEPQHSQYRDIRACSRSCRESCVHSSRHRRRAAVDEALRRAAPATPRAMTAPLVTTLAALDMGLTAINRRQWFRLGGIGGCRISIRRAEAAICPTPWSGAVGCVRDNSTAPTNSRIPVRRKPDNKSKVPSERLDSTLGLRHRQPMRHAAVAARQHWACE